MRLAIFRSGFVGLVTGACMDAGRLIFTTDVFVRIQDDECGMTQEFIRERLFRPFDSTKGSESMGISVA